MAYEYNYKKSPNYTPNASCKAIYGVPRTYKEIAIHHWGSPTAGYTHDGVVNGLCNPARKASAHYVVSAGKVTRLVNDADVSWATNKANPWTISIEIDPKCELRATAKQRAYSDKVYATAGELIGKLRKKHGNMALVKHRKYSATACPGLISVKRLEANVPQPVDWEKVAKECRKQRDLYRENWQKARAEAIELSAVNADLQTELETETAKAFELEKKVAKLEKQLENCKASWSWANVIRFILDKLKGVFKWNS